MCILGKNFGGLLQDKIYYLYYNLHMDISIIIVNYNTEDLLKNCLNKVFEKTSGLDFEVIVVDNASSDNSCQMVKEIFPHTHLIESNENLGFGCGNNLGIKVAKGKYVFLLNSDCELKNNSIKILFDFMENNPNCGASGGNLYDKNDNYNAALGLQYPLSEWITTHSILKFIYYKKYKELRYYQQNFNRTKSCEVGFITGADLMIKKTILDEVGSFNPQFFMYFEETELQWRIKKAGYKIFFVPESEIYHLEGGSPTPKKKLLMLQSEFLYFRLTQGFFAEIIVRIISAPKHLKLFIKSNFGL